MSIGTRYAPASSWACSASFRSSTRNACHSRRQSPITAIGAILRRVHSGMSNSRRSLPRRQAGSGSVQAVAFAGHERLSLSLVARSQRDHGSPSRQRGVCGLHIGRATGLCAFRDHAFQPVPLDNRPPCLLSYGPSELRGQGWASDTFSWLPLVVDHTLHLLLRLEASFGLLVDSNAGRSGMFSKPLGGSLLCFR
jgi:hypothetical protein